MLNLEFTINNDLCIGKIELQDTKGVVRGPFGEVIGFYQYENNLTTNKDETLYLTGNKSIQLILKHIEKLQQEGVTIKFSEFNDMEGMK